MIMTDFEAIGYAEGFLEPAGKEEILAAWQHLVNTGLAWKLQGWFGRNAQRMIEEGIINERA
jgi:hypothetical protein|tara:strand:- start:331 stop:516 length:186 start_codon:yes stop_codon:yes gene_type:complete